MSKPTLTREPCGCAHTGSRWVDFCIKCKAEWETHHRQAQKDYQRTVNGRPDTTQIEDLL